MDRDLHGLLEPSPLDRALVLVVGARRSGTNWLQRILATHPDVVAIPGETHFFNAGVRPLMERFQHANPASPTVGHLYAERHRLRTAARSFCDAVLLPYLEAGSGTRLLERTPEHVNSIALIADLYPEARFIHLIRDGRDAVRSLVSQSFGPSDVLAGAREWRDAVSNGKEQGARVAHYLEVRYESLRTAVVDEARKIFDFLDLPVDDDILQMVRSEADVKGNRWQGGDPPRLRPRDLRVIDKVAGGLLAELGYTATRPTVREYSRPRREAPDDRHWSAQSQHWEQYAVDRLLENLQPVTPDSDLSDLLAPAAVLEIRDGGERQVFRGDRGASQFLEAMASDRSLRLPVTSADSHSARRLVAVVNHYEDGGVRLFLVRLTDQGVAAIQVHCFGP